jgi:hypothetical protein
MNVTTMQQAIRQRVRDGLAAAHAAPIAPAPGARDVTRMMRRDRNGDGQLGRDEFQPSQARRHSQLDLNGDGKVSMAELTAFVGRVARQPGVPVPGQAPEVAPLPLPRWPGSIAAPEARPAPRGQAPSMAEPPAPVTDLPPPASVTPGGPAPAPPAPVDAPPVGRAPYINQYQPAGAEQGYTNGAANCGPASMAMIARAVGYRPDLTDAALINHLGAIGGTTAAGTAVANLAPMAEAMGLSTQTRGPGADVGWIQAQLEAGKMVVANGDYYEMAPHRDSNLTGGHYVLVTGMTPEGNFQVQDPADAAVSTVSPAEMERFIASNPNGGYQVAVG